MKMGAAHIGHLIPVVGSYFHVRRIVFYILIVEVVMARKKSGTGTTQLHLPWIDVPAEWTIKDVGAPLLVSLAEGLYDAQEVLREYVQNAIDSYVDFRRLTGRDPQNTVQVFIDAEASEVRVVDRGVGMDQDDIKLAKAIGVSSKLSRLNEFVGFRGIGIWSGLSVCDTLRMETTKIGVPYLFRLEIDFKSIRDQVYQPIPIDELLQGRFEIHQRGADPDEHYTEVTLVNVQKDRYSALVDVERMTRYAEQYLPVPFDPQWTYTKAVREALTQVPWTGIHDITINGEPVYRRFPPATEIKFPEFASITDDDQRQVGFAWWAETGRTGQRKAIELNYQRGEVNNFAVRIKNFAVGRRGQYAQPPEVLDHDNLDWYVGEIYITDTDIKPDTNRRTFQRTFRSDPVIQALQKFYTSVATRARGWSEEVNVLAACDRVQQEVRVIEQLLEQQESRSDDEPADANLDIKIIGCWKNIKDEHSRLNDALNKANAQDTDEDSPRVLAARRYLRKQNVKDAIERALGNIARIEGRLSSSAPTALTHADNESKANGQRVRRQSRARTARAKGAPITAGDALGTQAVTGQAIDLGPRPGDEQEAPTLVRLDLALSAFLATVAAIVGEGTEVYRQIEERLPDELRRRGVDV